MSAKILLLMTILGSAFRLAHADPQLAPMKGTLPYPAKKISAAKQLNSFKTKDRNLMVLAKSYQPGWEFCEQFKDAFEPGEDMLKKYGRIEGIKDEPGLWVKVPVSYRNPKGPKIPIYAYFRDSYDPSRPTVIIFDGGPGTNTHHAFLSPRMTSGFNELHFDQRGIACSQAPALRQHLDQSIYSTENTIQDADQIRKALGIEKVSVYGASYGTIPATRYASKYAAHTTALVLEGTYFSHELSPDHGRIKAHLEELYAKLPEATKRAMLSYFDQSKKFWLYSALQGYTYASQGAYNLFSHFLQSSFFPDPDHINRPVVDSWDPKTRTKDFSGINVISPVVFSALECKEKQDSMIDVVQFYNDGSDSPHDRFQSMREDTFEETGTAANCRSIGARPDSQAYSADLYPVIAPVTYFQGTWDMATDRDSAKKHWETVPQGPKQALLAKRGSHMDYILSISTNAVSQTSVAALQRVFENALVGIFATVSDLEKMNTKDPSMAYPVKDSEGRIVDTTVDWVINEWPADILD